MLDRQNVNSAIAQVGSSFSARQVLAKTSRFNRVAVQHPKIAIQPPISTIPCNLLYLLANPLLPFLMFRPPRPSSCVALPFALLVFVSRKGWAALSLGMSQLSEYLIY